MWQMTNRPDVREGVFSTEPKILSFGLIPELSSFDPFNIVNQEADENKAKFVEQFKSPPSLIPAKMKDPSPISEEPNHRVYKVSQTKELIGVS